MCSEPGSGLPVAVSGTKICQVIFGQIWNVMIKIANRLNGELPHDHPDYREASGACYRMRVTSENLTGGLPNC